MADGVVTNSNPDHPLTKALRELVRDHGLVGAVLLTFTDDRAGVNSSGCNPEAGAVMTRLADEIFSDFDAGRYDGALAEAH